MNKLFKWYTLVFYGLLIIILQSCGARQSIFSINSRVDYQVGLGLSLVEAHFFVKNDVALPINVSISSMGFTDDDIAEINPLRCIVQPRFGDNINLDFINAINVFIIDPDQLRRKEIFYLDFVQGGTKTEIELLPTLIDIRDYVINDRAIIEMRLDLRQFPPESFEIELLMEYAAFPSE